MVFTLPIDILPRGHDVGDLLRVYLVDGIQRQLHDEPVHSRVLIHLFDSVKDLKEGEQAYNSQQIDVGFLAERKSVGFIFSF